MFDWVLNKPLHDLKGKYVMRSHDVNELFKNHLCKQTQNFIITLEVNFQFPNIRQCDSSN